MKESSESEGRNCANCVFNLRTNEQTSEFGLSIGTDTCGAGLGPTGIPGGTAKQNLNVGKLKAASCDQYSKGDGSTYASEPGAERKSPVVMLPNPATLSDARRGNAKESGSRCTACAFFIPPAASLSAGLWNAGICAARGILITTKSMPDAAEDCADKTVGARRDDLLDWNALAPEYSKSMQVASATGSFDRTSVAPEVYETDAPVKDEDKVRGVRAWREVNNPEGASSVMLPIFDPEFFDEDIRKGIPKTGDDEHPEEYIDHLGLVYKTAVLWMHLDETPTLWGGAGSGKTEFYRHMAWLMGLPFNRISITASTEVEDLAGKMHYEPTRGTYFQYGRMPKAWKSPGIVCLDEPNVGPPDVWQFIRPLTDNSKQLVLDMNDGERIDRHELAFLGLAMNPAWDVRNGGTSMLADADGSRLAHIFVDLPEEKVERDIIQARVKLDGAEIDKPVMDAIMGIAKDLRAMSRNETLPITWGVRQQIKVARALRFFEMPQAYRLAAADYLEPEHQEMLLDVVKSHAPATKARPVGPARTRGEVPVDTDRKKASDELRKKLGIPSAPTPPPMPPMPPTPPLTPVWEGAADAAPARTVGRSISLSTDPLSTVDYLSLGERGDGGLSISHSSFLSDRESLGSVINQLKTMNAGSSARFQHKLTGMGYDLKLISPDNTRVQINGDNGDVKMMPVENFLADRSVTDLEFISLSEEVPF